tara:strand:- start:8234 stop:9568 length:1335 start_codon:yes stop_codon:yes gene_type:complete
MGLFKSIKKGFKKVVGGVKKVVSGVAKGVKKAVKGVAKVVREVGRGVKKLTKNKYVRIGLMIAAAVTLPMFVPAIAALPAVAAGAVTGAITGGAGALLQGGDLKDVLKGAAFGSATGAAFAKIGEAIKTARGVTDFKADTVGGKLDAMGGSGDIASTAPDISFDTSATIDLDNIARDSLGQIDLTKINPVDVAPEGALRNITSSAFDTPIYQDALGRTFTSDLAGNMKLSGVNLTSPPSIDFATLPKLNSTGGLDFANVTGRTAPVGGVRNIAASNFDTPKYVDSLGTEFSTDELLSGGKPFPTMGEQVAQGFENVNLEFPKVDTTTVKPTLGEKIRSGFADVGDRLKDAFSPENIVDKTLEVGENLLVGAAQGAIADRMADDQYVGDPAYAQQEYANQLQQFQIAYQNAGINLNDAYANMTYGSGDINAMGNELFRQDTIRIV